MMRKEFVLKREVCQSGEVTSRSSKNSCVRVKCNCPTQYLQKTNSVQHLYLNNPNSKHNFNTSVSTAVESSQLCIEITKTES
jgi:hypothetical protein